MSNKSDPQTGLVQAGIIGAGPVGSLLAVNLAKRGVSSTIFERRGDLRVEKISAGRSINLALSTRGIHALQEAGVGAEVLRRAVPMYGRMIHFPNSDQAFQRYGVDDSQHLNSISRLELSKILMSAAEATGRVKIRFHEKVDVIDLHHTALESVHELNGEKSRSYFDLLFSADGSASVGRQSFTGIPGFQCTQDHPTYGYKELTIPPDQAREFQLNFNVLHIWPRGKFMLIALPNFDQSFTCTLFLPSHGDTSFEKLKTSTDVEEFFEKFFPDAKAAIPDLNEAFFANPTGGMVTVKCEPWNQKKVLLLGDAAHAILPFFGQGLNCGFEDCTVLDQLMGVSNDFEEVFAEFSRLRKPNADKIADMATENFVEMRDKVGDPRFLLRKSVETLLQRAFPNTYFSRYSLVTFSRIPYQVASEIGVVGDEIVLELAQGIQKPEDVDLKKAADLIQSKFTPLIEKQKEYHNEFRNFR